MLNKISSEEAKGLVKKYFNKIIVEIKELDSYYDQNFYMKDKNSNEFVFKRASLEIYSYDILEFQNKMINNLGNKGLRVPKVIKSIDGNEIIEEEGVFLRLLTYLPGNIVANDDYNSELLKNVGKFSAEVDLALKDFFHPASNRDKEVWDMQNALLLKNHLNYVKDPDKLKSVNQIILEFENKVVPVQNELRKGVTHNDENEFNILSTDGKNISALIDYGDACYTHYINNLAVVIAHFMLRQKDPIIKGSYIYKGYNKIFPLFEVEKKVLPTLIKTRLSTMIIENSYNLTKDPKNDYIKQGIIRAWNTLQKIANISTEEILKVFEK